MDTLFHEQWAKQQGFLHVAGVDEAGRGPLAGPVVAAAVVLPAGCDHTLFRDSKKLSAPRREKLFAHLAFIEALIGVGSADHREIDQLNILQASLLAMRRAVCNLSVTPDFLLVDGKFPVPVDIEQQTLIKGELKSASVAAASIVAKVTRDRLMMELHEAYPHYRLNRHKGYPTKLHRELLRLHGPCPVHRRSFRGVRELLEEEVL